MKALVLCGGIPQVALIEELKSRGIYTILADMNPNVVARSFADKFYPVSVFDVNGIKEIALKEHVDFVITACADQVLLVQAEVSEMLGLPCYIDYGTAKTVSSKELMKKQFMDSNIPTSKYIVMSKLDLQKLKGFVFPLIVKPIDSYSSRGVKKVYNISELKVAFLAAKDISRTNTVIIEEFVEGEEITVDAYVENGEVHILCVSNTDKIPSNEGFVICRTRYPAQVSVKIESEVQKIVGEIAKAFNLENSPMLIQMITDGNKLSVVEFCARTGGGDKFRLIKQVSHFDVIKAVVDLTLGKKPHVIEYRLKDCIINEFLYSSPGVFDYLEGFEELQKQNIIKEYFQLKNKGAICGEVKSSGDRVAYYTIQATTMNEAREMDMIANENLKVIGFDGKDMLRHDLIATF